MCGVCVCACVRVCACVHVCVCVFCPMEVMIMKSTNEYSHDMSFKSVACVIPMEAIVNAYLMF